MSVPYTGGLFGFDLMRNAKPVTRFRTVTKSPRLTGLARAHPLHHPFAGRNTDAVGPLEKRKPQDVVVFVHATKFFNCEISDSSPSQYRRSTVRILSIEDTVGKIYTPLF